MKRPAVTPPPAPPAMAPRDGELHPDMAALIMALARGAAQADHERETSHGMEGR